MKKEKMIDWLITALVAVIYLVVSFVFDIWACSWVIWVAYIIGQILLSEK
ncbi:MAG: hypothetical protein NC483_02255 [Ruminococcus sp.]|nr:hypothetical protein [Ruminococcus sp.]